MIGPYLTDLVTLRMDMGSDEWQEPNTPKDVTVRAYIDYGEHKVENAAGELVVSMAKVYIRNRDIIVDNFATRSLNTISYKDKLVFDGVAHAILRINRLKDFSTKGMLVYVT